jgi:hypothetical protein
MTHSLYHNNNNYPVYFVACVDSVVYIDLLVMDLV